MADERKLTERHQQILRATVRRYVATAEPVSSKSLAGNRDFAVSPATIRNAMGWLEQAGLLFQPHTSAGRIPSDWGYRLYVDRLIEPDERLGSQTERFLNQRLDAETGNLEALLHGAAQLLGTLSGYIALVTWPQTPHYTLKHLQLVRLDSGRVMLIVVTDAYETQSVLMGPSRADGADRGPDERELQVLSNFLNHKLRGRSLAAIACLDWSELDREFQQYARLISSILQALRERSHALTSAPIVVRGISEVLRQPEFSQLQQVQTLLHLLEAEPDQLWPLMFELPASEGSEGSERNATVRIGSENPLEPMRSCTLISAHYCQADRPVGSVGLIGPTRMLYESAIALVEAVAGYLSATLNPSDP